MEEKLRALRNLETIATAPGRPQAEDLAGRRRALLDALPSVPFEMDAVDATASPECARHRVPFGAPRPSEAAETLAQEVDAALAVKLQTLRGQTVSRLLRDRSTAEAKRIADALGVQDDDHWVRLLSDETNARDVGAMLGSIVSREAPVIDELRRRFPTITRENLDDAVGTFRAGLLAAIEQAERERGADVTVEVTLR